MIAPLKNPQPPCKRPANSLALARRAVAAMLFQRSGGPNPRATSVSVWGSWAIVIWTLLMAASYFVLAGWWTVDRY
jgi:hypothetical protein